MQQHDHLSTRIVAVILSVVMFATALAGLAAWGIAKSYFIEDQFHFYGVLGVSVFLFITDAYCIFVAIIGYRMIPPRINTLVLTLLAIALLPALLFVSMFYT